MAVNKVTYGGNTLIDLTSDTVTADKLASGITAHDKSGAIITGTSTYDRNSSEVDPVIANLNSQVSTLTTEKTNLSNQVSTLTTEKTNLSNQVSTLTTEKNNLSSQVSTLTTEKTNLSNEITSGKTNIGNAINGHLGTSYGTSNTFADMASAITNNLGIPGAGKLEFKDRNSDVVNGDPDVWYTFNDVTILYALTKVTSGRNGYLNVKADKRATVVSLSSGEVIDVVEPGVQKTYKTENNSDMSIFGYCLVVCEEPANIEVKTWYTYLNARPIV